ncbi:MAG: GNAT family N-acetyltransferase [Silvibacterium sp.]|nr:GNAT family N-acetyltransferase [Silvibacterium sp.]
MAVSIELLAHDASPPAIASARDLLLEFGRFVTRAEGAERFGWDKLQEEVDGLPDTYRHQNGEMLLAYADGQPAGCVTWRDIPAIPGACEMKRLWVRPAFRGLGLGEQLILTAIERATRAGFDAMYLDTFPGTMKSAFDMYRRLGFAKCEAFNDSAYEGVVFMRRALNQRQP